MAGEPMKLHEVKCDSCEEKAPLKYNGEHWLVPVGWMELYDENEAKNIDIHVCKKCISLKKGNKKNEHTKRAP
jgi:hypothetical protein